MKLKSKTENLSEKAYFLIRSSIMRGEILPGTRLKEETLSATLEMSRTPVRTALQRLIGDGLLCVDEDRSVKVPEITSEELQQTFYAREVVECALSELACIQGSKEDFLKMGNLLWQQEIAYAEHDTHLALSLDRMFHSFIAEVAKNEFLKEFENKILLKISNLLILSRTFGEPLMAALKEHAAIVDAMKTKDSAKAREATAYHVKKVEERIRIHYPDDGLLAIGETGKILKNP